MKTSTNFARVAVTAGLTAVMTLGNVVAPAAMALADTGSTVTFTDVDYAASTTYKGIQIFKAKVATTGGTQTVSNIEWANDDAKKAVLDAIKAKDASFAGENAQDAADWLNVHAGGFPGTGTMVASDDVLSMIAANLKASNLWRTTTKDNTSLSGLEAGYWLFLTDTAGTPGGTSTDTFTSPIYVALDGVSATTVKPKKGVPTVEKKVLDDAEAAVVDPKTSDKWNDVADSQIGQKINYRLTGTIASNYATYSTYAYKFTDVLSRGLDYVDGSVEVYALNGNDYSSIDASKYDVAFDNNTLTVEFKVGDDKKGLKDVAGVDANSKIVVFYKAKLNGNAVIGNADGNKGGNPNTVKLEYSNNPYAEGTGETIENTVADFAFKLNLNKVDQGTERGLAGAVFTIQSDDANTEGQYVASKADAAKGIVAGQLVAVADANNLPEYVKFTSGSDGKIAVSGLDAGSYKVTEVQTPDKSKYTKANPFTFTIKPKYDDKAMKVTGLTASVSEADKGRTDIAFGTLDGTVGDHELTGKDGTGTNAAAGEVTINVGNTKSVGLPITGLNGVTLTWVAGGAVLVIGVAHLIRGRREESEE